MLLKRHRTHDYPAELKKMNFLNSVTQSDLVEMVSLIPLSIREKLKEGPLPRRFRCGVCKAFGKQFEGYDITINTNDPAYQVWVYHELPKANFTHADQNYYGEGANEIYRRCIATYRAAGWKGIAQEANA